MLEKTRHQVQQMQLDGAWAIICKSKNQQHDEEAQIVDQEEEDQLFVATYFSSIESSESWLINSGCTNHMTHD